MPKAKLHCDVIMFTFLVLIIQACNPGTNTEVRLFSTSVQRPFLKHWVPLFLFILRFGLHIYESVQHGFTLQCRWCIGAYS